MGASSGSSAAQQVIWGPVEINERGGCGTTGDSEFVALAIADPNPLTTNDANGFDFFTAYVVDSGGLILGGESHRIQANIATLIFSIFLTAERAPTTSGDFTAYLDDETSNTPSQSVGAQYVDSGITVSSTTFDASQLDPGCIVSASSATPTVTDDNISIISSGSGTNGEYIIGDTVTVQWDNTSSGDDNASLTNVTADFSAFGASSDVTMSQSIEIYTASYTIVSGDIDTADLNVSVTAENGSGSTTTADTSNLTVDNEAPTVTDASISINSTGSGGGGGIYIIGDTVTVEWDNSTSGDNNDDIASVNVDFSEFGASNTVSASENNGTWTANYTIAAGNITTIFANVSVTATDNVGNTTTTADTTEEWVDNEAPSVTSITRGGTTPTNADTLTWTVLFDAFVDNVGTDDFTISVPVGSFSVVAESGTIGSYVVTASGGNLTDLDGDVTLAFGATQDITDAVGNPLSSTTPTGTEEVTYTVDNTAPTVTADAISIFGASGPSGEFIIGDTVTAEWDSSGNSDVASVNVDFSEFGGGSDVSATENAGTWEATYTIVAGSIEASSLNVSVTATDDAGNAATTADTTNAEVDNKAPSVTSITRDGTNPTNADTLTWTIEFDEAVENVWTDDFTVSLPAPALSVVPVWGTTGSYVITESGSDLADLEGDVTLAFDAHDITDAAGNPLTNTTPTGTNEPTYTLDNTAPTVTDDAISISGASGTSGQFIIGDTATAEWDSSGNSDVASVSVDFSEFGGGSAVPASENAGTWEATYTIAAGSIEASSLNVSVTATDDAGNAATTADTTDATVDNIRPSVTSITRGSSTPTNADTLTWTVLFDEFVDNVGSDDFTISVPVDSFSVVAESGTIGSYVVTASGGNLTDLDGDVTLAFGGGQDITDAAGNSLSSTTPTGTNEPTYTLDNDAPDAPSTPDMQLVSDSGASGTDNITNIDTPSFVGTANAGVTVTLISSVDGTVGTATTDGTGSWAITASSLSETDHVITATAADALGNISAASGGLMVTIDTNAPTVAEVTAVSTPTSDTTPDYIFSTDEAGSLAVGGSCGTSSATTLSSTGNQTITLTDTDDSTALSDGTYADCTVTVTDTAGNASGQVTITSFDVDTATRAISIADVSQVEGDSGSTDFIFTITVSETANGDISVDYTTSDGSATAGVDYTSASGTATISDGETSTTITVSVAPDTSVEEDETFTVTLSNPAGFSASVTDATATGTIENDDVPAVAINSVDPNPADESNETVTIEVGLSTPALEDTIVSLALSGTATGGGVDYTIASMSVTIGAGQTTGSTTLTTVDDTIFEPITETVVIDINSVSGGSGAFEDGTQTTTVTITDDDSEPTMSVNDVTVDEDAGLATFTVNLSNVSTETVEVDFATVDDTAVAGSDYTSNSGTLTFSPGETSKTIDVTITDDSLDEVSETFTMDLSSASNASISDASGIGTITDNDDVPNLSIDDVSVAEGDGIATFTVSLGAASGQTVTVDFETVDDTAVAGSDYTSNSGTLTFSPGETSKTIDVTITDDSLDEVSETFTMDLASASNASISDASGIGTITDNDDVPNLSIDDVSVAEGDGIATFTVSLGAASGQTVTVDFETVDDTAIAGSDYTSNSGTLTFSPGETSKTIDVTITDDSLDEVSETFTMDLASASNASISDASGIGTITDNDDVPNLSIDDVSVAEGDGIATFTVSLDAASGQTVTVDFETVDDTAVAGSDYASNSGTLTFSPSETSKTIDVVIADETVVEVSESFNVDLSSVTNALISDASGTATITNDDGVVLVIDDVAADEDGGDITVIVSLGSAVYGGLTVDVSITDGTATAGSDYTSITSQTLTFAGTNGETQSFIISPTVDAIVEGDETITVTMSNPTASVVNAGDIDASDTATITLINDDFDTTPPTVTLATTATNPFNGASFFVTATFSEDVTGFEASDVTLGNGAISDFTGSGADYSFAVTPSSDGDVTVDIADGVAQDNATNNNSAATQLSLSSDQTAPTISGMPSDKTVEIDFPDTTSVVTWTPPTVNDSVSAVSLSSTSNPGEVFAIGTTAVVYTATDTAGNSSTASFQITVTQTPPGSVTFKVNSDVDTSVAFTSTEPALSAVVSAISGNGSSGAIAIRPGTYDVAFAVDSALGVADANCTSGGQLNSATQSGSVTVTSGAAIICTVTLLNSVEETTKLIGDFIGARGNLILHNQMDLSRRLERLSGRYSNNGSVSAFGLGFRHPDLPFSAAVSEGSGSFSYSLRRSQAQGSAPTMIGDPVSALAQITNAQPVRSESGPTTNSMSGQTRVPGTGALRDEQFAERYAPVEASYHALALDGEALNPEGAQSYPDFPDDLLENPARFDVWAEGAVSRFDAAGSAGTFAIAHTGIDYLVTNDMLIGVAGSIDWVEMDNDNGGAIEGYGFMVGPYATARLAERLYGDARLAWGQSWNDISPFGTYTDNVTSERWLATLAIMGDIDLADFSILPELRANWFKETTHAYQDTLGVDIPSVTHETGELEFGPAISKQFRMGDDLTISPEIELKGIWTFAEGHTDATQSHDPLRARVEAGLDFAFGNGTRTSTSLSYDGIGTTGFEAWGLSVDLRKAF